MDFETPRYEDRAMFEPFPQFIEENSRTKSSKLLDYDFERALHHCGLLYRNFSTKTNENFFNLTNVLAYFLTFFNLIRIIFTMLISDQSIGLTLCDIGILFGNIRLLGDAAFISSYLGQMGVLWAFSAINRKEPHANWIRIYFDDQNIDDWTHDPSSWNNLRKMVNIIYTTQAVIMMGIFIPGKPASSFRYSLCLVSKFGDFYRFLSGSCLKEVTIYFYEGYKLLCF